MNKTDKPDTLPVMEDFYTIQGEGFHQGAAAYFIRLAGCDVGCVWCDVKESWDEKKHPLVKEDSLLEKINVVNGNIVVITGGEPLMHNLDSLTSKLHHQHKKNHLETSGAYLLSGEWDWICVSPKKFKPPLDSVLLAAHELKVVVYNKTDFDWAESFSTKMNEACKLFLQPEWSREKEMLPLIIDYVQQHPQWKISLQVHKYMNIR